MPEAQFLFARKKIKLKKNKNFTKFLNKFLVEKFDRYIDYAWLSPMSKKEISFHLKQLKAVYKKNTGEDRDKNPNHNMDGTRKIFGYPPETEEERENTRALLSAAQKAFRQDSLSYIANNSQLKQLSQK